jgi:NADH-quinone oxidoreductase subunit D
MNNNLSYVLAVEKLLDIEIPERATYIRVIMSELQRIASHLFWLSTGTMDMSGMGFAVLSYATRERERILDLFEMVCGARITLSYMRIGGVVRDLPPAFMTHVDEFLRRFPGFLDDYEKMVTESAVFKARTIGIGKLSREQVMDMGLTGAMLRGSGVDWDLRRDAPYLNYGEYNWKVPVFTDGDGYARYLVRMEEMRQSVRIVEQALKKLPAGLFRTNNRKITPPPRAEIDVSMEALIHHFKLWTEGMRVPPGMSYTGIEASKGELGHFIYSDGSGVPYRLHVRGPSFNNMYAIRAMSKGHMLSDVVTNIASIDPVLGEVDR